METDVLCPVCRQDKLRYTGKPYVCLNGDTGRRQATPEKELKCRVCRTSHAESWIGRRWEMKTGGFKLTLPFFDDEED